MMVAALSVGFYSPHHISMVFLFSQFSEEGKSISQLLSWLLNLPAIKDNTTPHPPRPCVSVPLVDQIVTGMTAGPVRLVPTATPVLQVRALQLADTGRLASGVFEGREI